MFSYADQVSDLFTEFIKRLHEPDQAKKDEMQKKLNEEFVPNTLKVFESRLTKNNNGFLVGNGLTWAEIYLFVVLDWCSDREKALENFPLVKALDNRIKTTPKIAEWLAKRPQTAI
jgi:glutathione S-transferase